MKKIAILCLLSLAVYAHAKKPKHEPKAFFDLPISNATGYAFVDLHIRASANKQSPIVGKLKPSDGFRIIEEVGDFWKISTENTTGYVKHAYCYINLPDVLPSIVYKNTNSTASVLKAGEIPIPNITNHKLYDVYTHNPRLGEDSFIMPIKYETAKRLSVAQLQALKDGNTLVIYETFRPYKVQRKIVDNLINLVKNNKAAHQEINSSVWKIGWFISTGVSNHQRGIAVDLSLGKVVNHVVNRSGSHEYIKVTEVQEYPMQTDIHQLSVQSVIFNNPAKKHYAKRVTQGTLQLHQYMKKAGFTPLSSEWWHFDDKNARRSKTNVGNYFIDTIYSQEPAAF